MVKADLTRDYYADLEISATATETEIKKQFRILALKYHPDRNPGREAEVNSKFQTIQSAVEVLTDPEQRAKYDTGRARAARGGGGGASAYSSSFASQARPASGFARGNPYANAGAGFPPPPRREARPKSQAPPPSAGANRYASNFGVPRPWSYVPKSSTAQDDAESRRKTYEAWNRMRPDQRQPEPNAYQRQPEPTAYERSRPPPPPPPQPQSRPSPPPIPKRTGYAPNSMHDEPPAPNTSAYSSQRHRAPTAKQETYAGPLPRKQAPAPADQFKTFGEQSGTPLEPRLSTPYAGRGNGERTNPFESANLGRSNTTRQDSSNYTTRQRYRSVSPSRASYHPNIAPDFNESNRAGSETNINGSPKRTFSKTSKPSNLGNEARSTPIIDFTSSEEEDVAQRKYAKPKTRKGQHGSSTPSRQNTAPQAPFTTPNPAAQTTTSGTPNGDPKMYDLPRPKTRLHYLKTRASELKRNPARPAPVTRGGVMQHNANALNTPSGEGSMRQKGALPFELDFSSLKLSSPISPEQFVSSPSSLTPFESFQGTILDKLIAKNTDPNIREVLKEKSVTPSKEPKEIEDQPLRMEPPYWIRELDPRDQIMIMTPAYVVRKPAADATAKLNFKEHPLQNFASWEALVKFLKELAADMPTFRFSFKVEGQTYTAHSNPTRHSTIFTPQGTEKINTNFTPEDWQEKFEAGGYFGGTNPPTPSRQSSSSSGAEHANPLKPRGSARSNSYPIVEGSSQPKTEEAAQSPERGPKFTPDEWAETFKPNVFAAPQHTPAQSRAYSRSGTTRRQKHAAASGKTSSKPRTAAVESDDDSDPLFMGPRPVSKNEKIGDIQGSPMEMDIDPPNTSSGGARNVNVEPSRPEWRTGQPSAFNSAVQSPDLDQTKQAPPPAQPQFQQQFDGQIEQGGDLKTNFEDFKTTEPFMQTAQGLGSFADLKSNLPFQSKASSAVPFPKSFDSRELVLPPPPRGPKPPSTDTRPTSHVFDAYLDKIRAYMAEWITFDAQMVGHFAVRNEAVQMVSRQKVDWLGTLGDAHLDEYLENVRQDERAREWWATAVEKHREKMEEFKWVKSVFRDGPQQAKKSSGLFGEVTA